MNIGSNTKLDLAVTQSIDSTLSIINKVRLEGILNW